MEWDLWTVFYSIVTFLIIESFYKLFCGWLRSMETKLFLKSSEYKLLLIIFTYLGVLFVYVFLFKDFIDDNNAIVNAVIILLPIFILYKIYDDGVKNKAREL